MFCVCGFVFVCVLHSIEYFRIVHSWMLDVCFYITFGLYMSRSEMVRAFIYGVMGHWIDPVFLMRSSVKISPFCN